MGGPLTAEQRKRWAESTGLVEWSEAKINYMCDLVADGYTFPQIAKALGVSENAAKGRFLRIRQSYGQQGV